MICVVVAGALLFAGCGGGDDGGGLSSDEVSVVRARSDIADFCSVYKTEPSDAFISAYETMLTAVRDLVRVYGENPDAKFEVPAEKKTLTMKQVMQEESTALSKCGRDGRQQAGVLEAALQQQS